MALKIREHSRDGMASYADISIAFTVARVLDVTVRTGDPGDFALAERPVEVPYVKDYDRIEHPADWAQRFDLSNWGFFGAWVEGQRVGAAAVVFKTPTVSLLEGRTDHAVLWDIRVASEARRLGIGAALYRAAVAWATARGCSELKVETQNVNVPACRFYAAQGCELRAVHRFAYPALPDEVQLLWYKDLRARQEAGYTEDRLK